MIKEKKKKSKYNYEKSTSQIIKEYVRTVIVSICIAIIITTSLAINARNEMIKDLYNEASKQIIVNKSQAEEIIAKADAISNLEHKSYAVCMHVGDLYASAGENSKAQHAYEIAITKAKPNILKPYARLIVVLVAQEKFNLADAILENIPDTDNKELIKFKSRSYIVIGDKYYSIGKFLSAAKSFEKAEFYYNKFAKKDKVVTKSIETRIIKSYVQAADVMVKMGLNSDAIRFLKKAEKYDPNNNQIKYKLAIIYSDLDPEKSVEYLEELLEKIPQHIDYDIFGRALMKAAHIADLDGRSTKAKYYRYKIHSIDLFLNRKVVYPDDIETTVESFIIKKAIFKYPIKANFKFSNVSNSDIINLYADFVLTIKDKPIETYTTQISNRNKPLFSNGGETATIPVTFNKKAFTKKELENYAIKIYIYKDKKYKTFLAQINTPQKSFYLSK